MKPGTTPLAALQRTAFPSHTRSPRNDTLPLPLTLPTVLTVNSPHHLSLQYQRPSLPLIAALALPLTAALSLPLTAGEPSRATHKYCTRTPHPSLHPFPPLARLQLQPGLPRRPSPPRHCRAARPPRHCNPASPPLLQPGLPATAALAPPCAMYHHRLGVDETCRHPLALHFSLPLAAVVLELTKPAAISATHMERLLWT